MKKFRKAAAIMAAVAVLTTACAVNAYAATQDTVTAVAMNSKDDDGKLLQWDISLLGGEAVNTVTIKMSIKDGGGWRGGGGAFGFEGESEWTEIAFGTNEGNMTIDDSGNAVATIDFSGIKPAEKGIVQLGWWWASGDVSDFVDLEINGKSVLGVSGVEVKPEEEETTAAEEEVAEETNAAADTDAETTEAAEEEAEEEWVSTFDASSVKIADNQAPYFDGLQFALRADNEAQASLESDFGFDITSVYGIRVNVEVDPADVEHGVWYGGSVGANCPSRGWGQHNFANGDGDELTFVESDGSITWQLDEPIFSEDDGYAFAFFQSWGGPIGVKSFELLDKDGNVIDYEAAAVETTVDAVVDAVDEAAEEAVADANKANPNTGVADVAVVAGLAVAAAGAAVIAKKRK